MEQCCQDLRRGNRHRDDGRCGSTYRYGNRRDRRSDAVLASADCDDWRRSQVSAALQESGRELPDDWQLGLGRHTRFYALHKFAHRHRPRRGFLQLRGSFLLERSRRRRSCGHRDTVEDGHRSADRLECNHRYRSRTHHPGLDLAVGSDCERDTLRVPTPRFWHQLARERWLGRHPRLRIWHHRLHLQLTQQLDYRSRIAIGRRGTGRRSVSVSDY